MCARCKEKLTVECVKARVLSIKLALHSLLPFFFTFFASTHSSNNNERKEKKEKEEKHTSETPFADEPCQVLKKKGQTSLRSGWSL